MSKPRWRYATRALKKSHASRVLWTRKPSLATLRVVYSAPGGTWKWVTRSYCIERFGRDLRPGERRPLP